MLHSRVSTATFTRSRQVVTLCALPSSFRKLSSSTGARRMAQVSRPDVQASAINDKPSPEESKLGGPSSKIPSSRTGGRDIIGGIGKDKEGVNRDPRPGEQTTIGKSVGVIGLLDETRDFFVRMMTSTFATDNSRAAMLARTPPGEEPPLFIPKSQTAQPNRHLPF